MRIINQFPTRRSRLILGVVPFAAIAVIYALASRIRLEANPADRLLPAFSSMFDTFVRLATEPDRRSGDIVLWTDTLASLSRLGLGLGIAAAIALVLGIMIGFVPKFRATLAPLVGAMSLIPPLAILPILFIVFGLDELSKVALIVIGITPVMTRDLASRVADIPEEQIVKAQTLGASSWAMTLRVVLPQTLPRLVASLRLALGPAWLFLIAAEAIAATDGLGYRIFLVRRYLAMDVILPYVAWITLLAWLSDLALREFAARAFPWSKSGGGL
ncbi:ABC transporter permease [Methylobrevis albus]|uniref:ABC transporter permease n=1 Tax=Methylobrevis albus TaxID=2793297 RepID=A0A931N0R8_9HYPH|nr:ABC transporter permease [Methylobrevis albus]MBH0239514.1 ABC transporter permease [Methylobrevis albus]